VAGIAGRPTRLRAEGGGGPAGDLRTPVTCVSVPWRGCGRVSGPKDLPGPAQVRTKATPNLRLTTATDYASACTPHANAPPLTDIVLRWPHQQGDGGRFSSTCRGTPQGLAWVSDDHPDDDPPPLAANCAPECAARSLRCPQATVTLITSSGGMDCAAVTCRLLGSIARRRGRGRRGGSTIGRRLTNMTLGGSTNALCDMGLPGKLDDPLDCSGGEQLHHRAVKRMPLRHVYQF